MARREEGMTLVEVVVALVLTGIIAVVVMGFTISNIGNFSAATARGQMLSELQLALDTINNDIILSASADSVNRIEDPYSPNGNTLGWNGDDDTLILATAAENTSGNILFADPSQYISHKNNIIYFLSGSTVYKRVLAAPVAGNKAITSCPEANASATCPADRKIVSNVSSFRVRYFSGNNTEVTPEDARSIELSVSLRQQKFGQTINVKHESRMVFRND